MNNLSKEQALEIIKKYQQSPPVSVSGIARDFGIPVLKGSTDPMISGKIIKDSEKGGSSGYVIIVNAEHPSVRQRFTIAHEIAHYILHRGAIGDGLIDDALYRSGLSNKIEKEANQLAAEILMPWHLINQFLDEKDITIEEMAKKFEVSASAMSIRLGVPC